MAEFKVVDAEKLDSGLTEIAEEVRELDGTEDKLTFEGIRDNLVEANKEVKAQTELIADIKTVLSDLDDGISALGEEVKELAGAEEDLNLVTMKEEVAAANGEIVDQSQLINEIREVLQGKGIKGKEEQRKEVTITENGVHSIEPDEGYTLSGVGVNVSVEDIVTKLTNDEIVEYSNDNITQLPQSLFYSKKKLQKISLANCRTIKNSVFYGCENLISVHFPNLETLDSNSFQNCHILPEACFPKLKGTVTTRSFCNDRTLNKIDLGYVTQITGAAVFFATSSLETLILRSPTLCTLTGTDTFGNKGLADGTGYIYVPKVLEDGSDGVETYSSATNWSVYAGQFRAIEDYPEITGGII